MVPETFTRLYGERLVFTDDERTLLTSSDGVLGPYEQQRAYVLKMALRAEKCPACGYILCPRSAWTGLQLEPLKAEGTYDKLIIDTSWAHDGADGRLFACPACRVRLVHHQGMALTEHWFTIASGQTVTVSDG
jgi:hypothetical protein